MKRETIAGRRTAASRALAVVAAIIPLLGNDNTSLIVVRNTDRWQ